MGDLDVITYDPGGLAVSGLFAGSSGQGYGSIVESARSRYIPFLLFCITIFQA